MSAFVVQGSRAGGAPSPKIRGTRNRPLTQAERNLNTQAGRLGTEGRRARARIVTLNRQRARLGL